MHYNGRGFHFVQTAAGKQQLSDLWAVEQEAKCIFESSGSLSAKHVSQRTPPHHTLPPAEATALSCVGLSTVRAKPNTN